PNGRTRDRRCHSSYPRMTACPLPCRVIIAGSPRAASSTMRDKLAFASDSRIFRTWLPLNMWLLRTGLCPASADKKYHLRALFRPKATAGGIAANRSLSAIMLHLEVPDLSIRSLRRILERLEVGALRSENEDVREGASLVDEREARTMAL